VRIYIPRSFFVGAVMEMVRNTVEGVKFIITTMVITTITLNDLEDPQGVCRLARSARHYLLDNKVHEGTQAMFSN
jgi:hypothetical protein